MFHVLPFVLFYIVKLAVSIVLPLLLLKHPWFDDVSYSFSKQRRGETYPEPWINWPLVRSSRDAGASIFFWPFTQRGFYDFLFCCKNIVYVFLRLCDTEKRFLHFELSCSFIESVSFDCKNVATLELPCITTTFDILSSENATQLSHSISQTLRRFYECSHEVPSVVVFNTLKKQFQFISSKCLTSNTFQMLSLITAIGIFHAKHWHFQPISSYILFTYALKARNLTPKLFHGNTSASHT